MTMAASNLTGGEYPARIFRKVMNDAVQGTKVSRYKAPSGGGSSRGNNQGDGGWKTFYGDEDDGKQAPRHHWDNSNQNRDHNRNGDNPPDQHRDQNGDTPPGHRPGGPDHGRNRGDGSGDTSRPPGGGDNGNPGGGNNDDTPPGGDQGNPGGTESGGVKPNPMIKNRPSGSVLLIGSAVIVPAARRISVTHA